MPVMRRKSFLRHQAGQSVPLGCCQLRFGLHYWRLAEVCYKSCIATLTVLCLIFPHVAISVDNGYPTARALPLSNPDHRSRAAHARRLDNRLPLSQELDGLITHPDGRILGHLLWDKPDSTEDEAKNPANKHQDRTKWRTQPRTQVSQHHQAINQQQRPTVANGWNRKHHNAEQPSAGSKLSSGGRIVVHSSSPASIDLSDRATSPASAIARPYIEEADQSRSGGIAPVIREISGDMRMPKFPATAVSSTPYKLPALGSVAFLNFRNQQQDQGTHNKGSIPSWVSRDIIPRLKAASGHFEDSSDSPDISTTTSGRGNAASSTEPPVGLPDDDVSLIQLLEEALDFLEDYPQYIDELDLDALYDYLTNDTADASVSADQPGISTSQRPATETSSFEEDAEDRTEEPDEEVFTSTDEPSSISTSTTVTTTTAATTTITTTPGIHEPVDTQDVVSFRPIELPRLEDLFSIKTNLAFTDAFDILSTASATTNSPTSTSSTTTTASSSTTSQHTTTTTLPSSTSAPQTSTIRTSTVPVMSSSSPRTFGRAGKADTPDDIPRKYNPLRPTRAPNVAVLIQNSKAKTPEEIRKLVEFYTNPKKLGALSKSPVEDPIAPASNEENEPVTLDSSSTSVATTTTTEKVTTPGPNSSTAAADDEAEKASDSKAATTKESAAGGGGLLVWPRGNKRGKPIFSTEAPSTAPPMSFDDFLKKFSVKEAPIPELVPLPTPRPTLVGTSKPSRVAKIEDERPEWTRTSFEDTPRSILDSNPWSFSGERGTPPSEKPATATATRPTTEAPKSDQRERMLNKLMNDRSNQNLWTTRLGGRPKQNQNSQFDFDSLSSAQGGGGGGSVLSFGKKAGANLAGTQDRTLVIDTFSEAVGPDEEEDSLLQETAVEAENAPVAASAIIVSTVIGSVAAAFFISLFVFCKWRQYRQIRRNTRMPMPAFGRARSRRQSTRSSYMRSPYYNSSNLWTLFGNNKTHRAETFRSSVSGFSDSS